MNFMEIIQQQPIIFTLTTVSDDYRELNFQATSTDIFTIIDKILDMQTGDSAGDLNILVIVNDETIPYKQWRKEQKNQNERCKDV